MNRSCATIEFFRLEKWRQFLEGAAASLQLNLIFFSVEKKELFSVYRHCPACGRELPAPELPGGAGIAVTAGKQALDVIRLDSEYLVAVQGFRCCTSGGVLEFTEKVDIAGTLLKDFYSILIDRVSEGQPLTELATLHRINQVLLSVFKGDNNTLKRVLNLILGATVIIADAGGCRLEYSAEGQRHTLTSVNPPSETGALRISRTISTELQSAAADVTLEIISPGDLEKAGRLLDHLVKECAVTFEIHMLLKTMEAKLPHILNATDSLVVAADKNRRICYVNKAALSLLNRPLDELIGFPVGELDTPWRQSILSETGQVSKGTRGILLCGFEEKLVDWEVYYPTDEMSGYLITARDRTDFYRLHDLLKKAGDHVHIWAILKIIEHEIRNPLTTFRGLLHIIDMKGGTPEISKYVDIGMSEIKKITLLLDQFSQSG